MTTTIIQHIETGWEKDKINEVPRKLHTSLRKQKQNLLFFKDKIVYGARNKQGFSSLLKHETESCQRMHEPHFRLTFK